MFMKLSRKIGLSLLGVILAVEAFDQGMMAYLYRTDKAHNFYLEESWSAEKDHFWPALHDREVDETRGPTSLDAPEVRRTVLREGAYFGRYQYSYLTRFFVSEGKVNAAVYVAPPERRFPLWIFSFGLNDFWAPWFSYKEIISFDDVEGR
ncbi:hypothetical protein KUV57_11350 [Epibacterium sp. DP7N7-1]|nr:hypothetical protein [Epibacterium sp. DP7N7-1]